MTMTNEQRDYLYNSVRQQLDASVGSEAAMALHNWLIGYKDNPALIPRIYWLVENGSDEALTDSQRGYTYSLADGGLAVESKLGQWLFDATQAKLAMRLMYGVMADCMPLGTVVVLRKEEFGARLDAITTDSLRVVINQRMAALPNSPLFFDYGGVIYPFGLVKGAESIYFSPDLIERVVHLGFSDEADQAFLTALKADLVLKRGYYSFALASDDERRAARSEMRS